MTRNPREQRGKLARAFSAVRENGPAVAVAVIAFTGSFTHIITVCHKYGMPGFDAYPVAGVVDLMCFMGAEERQRDKRVSRQRKGWMSWPTIILCLGVILTLAINEKDAQPDAWGWIVAAIAPVAMLLAVSLLERRASWQGSQNQNQPRREVPAAMARTAERRPAASSQNQAEAVAGTSADPVPGTRGVAVPEPAAELPAAQNPEPAGEEGDGRKLTMDELIVLGRRAIEEYADANDGKTISWEVLGKELGVAKAKAGVVLKTIAAQDAAAVRPGGRS